MRIQLTFSKTGALKYISQLDLHTIWERAARRSGLPLAYTQGFHPQPKINFASALPLGFTSRCEVVDLRLNSEVDPASLPAQLQPAMPPGITILKAEQVDDLAPSLPTQVIAAEYLITLIDAEGSASMPEQLRRKIDGLLSSTSLPRVRRDKPYDLRPLIEELQLEEHADHTSTRLHMRLTAREGATGRPEEVLDALGIPQEIAQIERTRLIFKS